MRLDGMAHDSTRWYRAIRRQLCLRAAQDSLVWRASHPQRRPATRGGGGAMRFAANSPRRCAPASPRRHGVSRQRDGPTRHQRRSRSRRPLRQRVSARSSCPPRSSSSTRCARTALDLNSAAAQELLGKRGCIAASSRSFAKLVALLTGVPTRASRWRHEVWWHDEANVRLTGTVDGDRCRQPWVEGRSTRTAGSTARPGRGERSFSVDSGRVRFYGTDAIDPRRHQRTNVVRSLREEIPIRVHIGGTIDRPALLSSASQLTRARGVGDDLAAHLRRAHVRVQPESDQCSGSRDCAASAGVRREQLSACCRSSSTRSR
jgi:hypothetical protein